MPFNNVHDARGWDGELARLFGINSMSFDIVIDENGVVPFHDSGDQMIKLGLSGPNAGELKQRVSELGSSSLGGNVDIDDIDAGNARGSFIVCFNQVAGVSADAMATITLQFLADDLSTVGGPVSLMQIVGDTDVGEWDPHRTSRC